MSRERPAPEFERREKKPTIDPCETREGILAFAILASDCDRYEQMFMYMRKLVSIVAPRKALTDQERLLFNSASTSFLEGQLDAYRHVAKSETDSTADPRWANAVVDYLQLIASEICGTCSEVLSILDRCVLAPGYPPAATEAARAESRVFYKKMKGDFLKYMVEVKKGADKEKVESDALEAYFSAERDEEALPAAHPTRLALRLSLAQFYYETRRMRYVALGVASGAVEMATLEMEATGQSATRDTFAVLGRLRYFVDKWSSGDVNAES